MEQAPSKFHTDFCAIDYLLTLYSILIFVIADDIFWNTFVCASLRRTWVFQSPIFSTCSGMELAVRFVVFSIPSVRQKYGNHMRNFLYKWDEWGMERSRRFERKLRLGFLAIALLSSLICFMTLGDRFWFCAKATAQNIGEERVVQLISADGSMLGARAACAERPAPPKPSYRSF